MVKDEPATDQAYVGVSAPSSTSVKVAEQFKAVPVTTLVFGEIAIEVERGTVLSIVMLLLDVTLAPWASITVAVHVTVSAPLIKLLLSLYSLLQNWMSKRRLGSKLHRLDLFPSLNTSEVH